MRVAKVLPVGGGAGCGWRMVVPRGVKEFPLLLLIERGGQ